jgi:hypothetical protein
MFSAGLSSAASPDGSQGAEWALSVKVISSVAQCALGSRKQLVDRSSGLTERRFVSRRVFRFFALIKQTYIHLQLSYLVACYIPIRLNPLCTGSLLAGCAALCEAALRCCMDPSLQQHLLWLLDAFY